MISSFYTTVKIKIDYSIILFDINHLISNKVDYSYYLIIITMTSFPEIVCSTQNSLIDSKSENFQRTEIGKGGFGKIYKVSPNWVEKVTTLFDKCGLWGNNLREINFSLYFASVPQILPIKYVYITDNGYNNFSLVSSMPFVDQDLHSYIKKTKYNERMLIFKNVFISLCHALNNLHSNGLIHMDLKSRNVLISKTNDVYLIDFSSVRFEINNFTDHNSSVASRPPEYFNQYFKKIENVEKFGPYNDIWSLGILMLEFICDENRLDSFDEDEEQIGGFVNREKPFPVRKILNENVTFNDETIIKLIESMLKRDFTKRPTLDIVYKTLCGKELNTSCSCIETFCTHKESDDIVRIYPDRMFEKKQHTSDEYNEERKNAILDQHDSVSNDEYEEIMYAFELGVSICDRYCLKTDEDFTYDLLEKCLYIAANFLNEETGMLEDFIEENFNLVFTILNTLEYDIYRPTFYSYLQQKLCRHVTSCDISVIFQLMCDVSNYELCYDELYCKFLESQKIKNSTPLVKKFITLEDKPTLPLHPVDDSSNNNDIKLLTSAYKFLAKKSLLVFNFEVADLLAKADVNDINIIVASLVYNVNSNSIELTSLFNSEVSDYVDQLSINDKKIQKEYFSSGFYSTGSKLIILASCYINITNDINQDKKDIAWVYNMFQNFKGINLYFDKLYQDFWTSHEISLEQLEMN
jgi:serine/threonine protein kinase